MGRVASQAGDTNLEPETTAGREPPAGSISYLAEDVPLAELCSGPVLLLATRGLPASGKTTWARRLLDEAPCFVRVNSDDLRAEQPRAHEATIRRIRDRQIMSALAAGRSVVVDNTNLRGTG